MSLQSKHLQRFWIEFTAPVVSIVNTVGVTAYSLEDALYLIQQRVTREDTLPEVRQVIENVDLDWLKKQHLLNPDYLGILILRGLWYPNIGFWQYQPWSKNL